MNESFEVDVVDSIERISPQRWDSVAGDSVGLNHAVLQCRERNHTGNKKIRYFRVHTADASMAVSVAVIDKAGAEGQITSRMFGRLVGIFKPLMKSLDKTLTCGRIPGPGAAVLTRRDNDQRRWMHIICDAMEEYARANDLTMLYTCVLPDQPALLGELRGRGYLCGRDRPIATMNMSWQDRKSYLNTLRHRRKRSYVSAARTEIRRFEASGATISRHTGNDADDLFELLRKHERRKNSRELPYKPAILSDFVSQLGDDCLVYVADRNDALIGVCVYLRRGCKAWAWNVGVDHEADAKDLCYFNLVYYYPCSHFPGLGITDVYFGNAVQYAKYRRGCDIHEALFFARATPRILTFLLRPLLMVQRLYFARKFRGACGPSSVAGS